MKIKKKLKKLKKRLGQAKSYGKRQKKLYLEATCFIKKI